MAIRPRFKRTDTFVVAKPIRLSSKTVLLPGDEISFGDYRLSQLKRWFRRRRIAQAGCDWANQLIEKYEAKVDPRVEEPVEVTEILIEQSGSWYTVSLEGEELTKVQGLSALNEWLTDNDYPPHSDEDSDDADEDDEG